MSQLANLKEVLGNTNLSDALLQFYLDDAGLIICEMRNSDIVEKQYLTIQVKIAMDVISKRGAEGQISHSENGISRMYESADISPRLINQIRQIARTPFSVVRVIVEEVII